MIEIGGYVLVFVVPCEGGVDPGFTVRRTLFLIEKD